MTESYGSNAIAKAAIEPLEIWESPSSIPYLIHLEHPEFASICPRSGYPDSGTMVIDYIPNKSHGRTKGNQAVHQLISERTNLP